MEVSNVLYLAGLGYSIALFLKSPFPVKLHHLLIVRKYAHEQKKTANNGPSTPFAMVTVKHCNSLRVCCQKMGNFVTNDK